MNKKLFLLVAPVVLLASCGEKTVNPSFSAYKTESEKAQYTAKNTAKMAELIADITKADKSFVVTMDAVNNYKKTESTNDGKISRTSSSVVEATGSIQFDKTNNRTYGKLYENAYGEYQNVGYEKVYNIDESSVQMGKVDNVDTLFSFNLVDMTYSTSKVGSPVLSAILGFNNFIEDYYDDEISEFVIESSTKYYVDNNESLYTVVTSRHDETAEVGEPLIQDDVKGQFEYSSNGVKINLSCKIKTTYKGDLLTTTTEIAYNFICTLEYKDATVKEQKVADFLPESIL